ncbi:MAG: MBL fold metallo-hydrolase [Candidatus Dormibacteraeota bacterium]|nr:MBL fold metallo-hydrolase [Candidatus Dormibacteraeota bacterium]
MARLGILKVRGERDVNCFVVSDSDAGEAVAIDPVEPAAKVLAQLTGLKVLWIVATHGHPGHLAGKEELKAATGAETAMHMADAKAFLKSADRYLVDGDELEFGGFKLGVMHTPGHTPGSLCFVVANHAFTGDTLLAGGIGKERPETDLRLQMVSIVSRLGALPPRTALYPGHGAVTSLEAEFRTSPVFERLRA